MKLKIAISTLLLVWSGIAADLAAWQNLSALRPGENIEVQTAAEKLKGEFSKFDPQAITIRQKSGERTIQKTEVASVNIAKSNRALWIGLAAGLAGGLIAGALLGARLENESGGDFAGIKGAVIGGSAAGGALIGLGVGAAARRGKVIYRR